MEVKDRLLQPSDALGHGSAGKEGLQEAHTAGAPSRGRWWVLAVYTYMAALQGLTWTVPGTIEPTYQAVYGMGQDEIQLLLNWGPIFYLLAAVPFMYWLDKSGIRGPTFAGIALLVVCAVLRLFANDDSPMSKYLVHISFILNATAGPVSMAVPSKLAEDWFPPNERTTATAVAALGNQSGTLLLYFIVPLLCPDPTTWDNIKLNGLLTAMCLACAAMAAWYFPNHPPHPPSASAVVTRSASSSVSLASIGRAWWLMARNPTYVLVCVAYSLILGLGNSTSALLTANLSNLPGSGQATAGWVGFAGNLGSMVVGVGLAGMTDRLKAKSRASLKNVLVTVTAISGVASLFYAICLAGALPVATLPGVTGLCIVAGVYVVANVFTGVSIPLMFDICAEQTYPLPEATMLMGLTFVMNAVSLVTLAMPASSFFAWANYGLAGVTLASSLALGAFLPTSAPRYDYDKSKEQEVEDAEGESEFGGHKVLV